MTEQQPVTVSIFAQTDVGRVRQNNEDNFLIADLTRETYRTAGEANHQSASPMTFEVGEKGFIAAVSDGMGGALAGEVASNIAVRAVRLIMQKFQSLSDYSHLPLSEQFRLALEQTNKLIHGQSQASPQYAGMGATFTGLTYHQGRIYLAQIGDSRAYIIRGDQIVQATKDQSLVGQLVDAGYLTEEQAQDHVYKNVILQALGAQPDTVVVVDRLSVYQNDVILLCSDGLSNKVSSPVLADVVTSSADLQQACQQLIRLANDRGGEDNITVVLCRFAGGGLPPPIDSGTFEIERIEREETLPADLLPDLVDPHSLLSQALENADHASSDARDNLNAPSAAEIEEYLAATEDPFLFGESPPEPNSVERNIVRVLIGLLIVIFLGAVLAVAWYVKTWRDKDQDPASSPLTTIGPRPPWSTSSFIFAYLYQFPT